MAMIIAREEQIRSIAPCPLLLYRQYVRSDHPKQLGNIILIAQIPVIKIGNDRYHVEATGAADSDLHIKIILAKEG